MARGRLIWRRLAEDDLTAAYLHIGTDSPSAAERFVDALEETTHVLLDHPELGRLRAFRSPLARGIRSVPVPGFLAYLVFYRASGSDIEITRILHGARDLPRTLDET